MNVPIHFVVAVVVVLMVIVGVIGVSTDIVSGSGKEIKDEGGNQNDNINCAIKNKENAMEECGCDDSGSGGSC